MRTVRSARGAVLILAVLALALTWVAVGGQTPNLPQDTSTLAAVEHGTGGTVTAADVADLGSTSVLSAVRTAEPRLGPLWVLPGLAAALAAVCLLRRLRASPLAAARRALLRDTVSRRGPPPVSVA